MVCNRIWIAVACVLALGFTACQSGGLTGGGATATGSPGAGSRPTGTGPLVQISPQDLAVVDAQFRAGPGGNNTRWVLGDVVDVVASREYFAGIISINRGPFVKRVDAKVGGETLVTLTFLGSSNQASASNNPRIQIGTGLTVTAYRTLRLRLTATKDARFPVRLHITATGNASRGHREEIIQRAPLITMGGHMVRSGDRWVWNPIGG